MLTLINEIQQTTRLTQIHHQQKIKNFSTINTIQLNYKANKSTPTSTKQILIYIML